MEARVYFESTFLGGDSGGFVAEDIELSGLTKIWSLESSYGWKGTGFLSENKKTESYLVSPEIDLSKAAAPSVVFDCAINYLKGAERSENFNLLISTDYAGDAASASWKTLGSYWLAGRRFLGICNRRSPLFGRLRRKENPSCFPLQEYVDYSLYGRSEEHVC